jgi:hypothetical protein
MRSVIGIPAYPLPILMFWAGSRDFCRGKTDHAGFQAKPSRRAKVITQMGKKRERPR